MKKLLIIVLFIFSCSSATTEDEINNISSDNVVKIEVLSEELNADELVISYYEYQTDSYSLKAYPVSYDGQGNPLPIIIEIKNYNFRYISGEVYRNNPIRTRINLKIYLNDEVIINESVVGNGVAYPIIRFNFDIKTKKNI